MSKKNCIKGIECGRSCISARKVCRIKPSPSTAKIAEDLTKTVKVASAASKAEPKAAPPKAASKSEAKPTEPKFTNKDDGALIEAKWKVNDHDVRIEAIKDSRSGVYEVNFLVDNEYTVEDDQKPRTERESRQIAKSVLSNMKKMFKELPEAAKIRVEASVGDGRGEKRSRLYEKFGFSAPKKPGFPQYAQIVNGKVTPVQESEFSESENTTDEEMEQLIYEIVRSNDFNEEE